MFTVMARKGDFDSIESEPRRIARDASNVDLMNMYVY
jgi:hypothetical protein